MSMRIAGTDDELEWGTTYVGHAARLWSIAGDERRARRIRDWVKDFWTGPDANTDDEYPPARIYPVGGLKHLLGLLEGLDEALRATVTDRNWRIDAVAAERIRGISEALVDSWNEEGGTVYTLANRVSEVLQFEAFLQRAIELDRPLEVR